jgi:hypothetical protein
MKYLKAWIKSLEIGATITADFTIYSIPLITTANSGDQKVADKKSFIAAAYQNTHFKCKQDSYIYIHVRP